jgi:hypothetical protein
MARKEAVNFAKSEGDNVTSKLAGKYMASDDDQKVLKTNLLMAMSRDNNKGFLPSLTTDEEVQSYAAKYAKQHSKDFGGNFHAAYEFALDNAEEIANDWNVNYKGTAKSFNHLDNSNHSNALKSGAIDYEFDSGVAHNNNQVVLGVLQNALTGGPGVKFQYGQGNSKGESDEGARKVTEQYVQSFLTTTGPKDKQRPAGTATISRIADYDDNFMMIKFNVNEDWANKPANKGGSKNPGITGDKRYQEGIVALIPKDKIDNEFYRSTETSMAQWALDKGKPLVIKGGDGKSFIEITKSGGTYNFVSNLPIDYDEKTHQIIYEKTTTSSVENYKADALIQNNTMVMQGVTEAVDKMIDYQTAMHGIKNINELIGSINQ